MSNYKYAALSMIIAFIGVYVTMPFYIPFLKKMKFGQEIREEGPKSHFKKAGTPTMGGVVLLVAVILTVLLCAIIIRDVKVYPLLVSMAFGGIGFYDDLIKIMNKENLGLRAWQKMVLQIVFAVVFTLWAGFSSDIGTRLYVPVIGQNIDFGFWYFPFTIFAVVAMVNAVNLTDGLDGLCAGVTGIVMLFFTTAAMFMEASAVVIFGGAVIGVCFAFLRYNSNPANIFMGDTGSMGLGGAVTAIAIMTRLQLFLLIAGIIYVLEALSVVMQVAYFKISGGKRIFAMTPIHHHFELKGWSETRVVTVFWIASALSVAVAFLFL